MFDADAKIRPTLKSVFPDGHHALMVVRLGGSLTIDEQGVAADRVVELVRATHFDGANTVPTGTPLLVKQINDRMRGDMTRLGAVAVLVMAGVLLLLFRVRWRLLSLAIMGLGIVWTFGALGYLGLPLTMVTISGLPILIGLGVDFAVQVHSRLRGGARRWWRGDDVARTHLSAARSRASGGRRRGGCRLPRSAHVARADDP